MHSLLRVVDCLAMLLLIDNVIKLLGLAAELRLGASHLLLGKHMVSTSTCGDVAVTCHIEFCWDLCHTTHRHWLNFLILQLQGILQFLDDIDTVSSLRGLRRHLLVLIGILLLGRFLGRRVDLLRLGLGCCVP